MSENFVITNNMRNNIYAPPHDRDRMHRDPWPVGNGCRNRRLSATTKGKGQRGHCQEPGKSGETGE
jgi:hypothetical protein